MKEILDFYNDVKNINYGWHDKDGNVHENLKGMIDGFVLQDNDTVRKTNYAVCWEMCELQREFFNSHSIPNKTIFVYLRNSHNNACHTFSCFYLNDKTYWMEASWQNKKGIHEFDSDSEVLEYYRNHFEDFARGEYNKEDLEFYEYDNITPGMNAKEFYMHCLNSKKIETSKHH